MGISYKKLRIILAERNIKPTDVEKNTNVSWSALTRISKNESVTLSTLEEICKFLRCDIGDIVEFTDIYDDN